MKHFKLHIFLLFLFFSCAVTNDIIAQDIQIIEGVENREKEKVARLLQKGANPNTINPKGASILMIAAKNGDLSIVELLVENGADVNYRSNEYTSWLQYLSVLDYAAISGDTTIVNYLLENGADINSKDKIGHTVLYTALFGKNVKMAWHLLNKGAIIEPDRAKLLLFANIQYEQEENILREPFTPLKGMKRSSVTRFLLEQGYDLDKEDETTQMLVRRKSKEEIEKIYSYIDVVKADIAHKAKEKHFTDSILSLSDAERDSDPIYEYRISKFTSSEDGEVYHQIEAKKVRRSIYIQNKLNDYLLTTILTFIYIAIIFIIIYFKLRKKKVEINKILAPILIFLAFVGLLSWYMFNSIIFNANELYTRQTGTQYNATISYYTKLKKIPRSGSYHEVYYPSFYYVAPDSLGRWITANNTTLSLGGEDEALRELKETVIAINEKNGRTAVLIPWHTSDNIYYIVVWIIILTLILLSFIGVFNKQFKSFFNYIENQKKKMNRSKD